MLCGEEPVDVRVNPLRVDWRNVPLHRWLESPVLRGGAGNCLVRSQRSGFDPGCQLCNFLGSQPRALIGRRHAAVVVRGNSFEDQTLRSGLFDECRTAISAFANEAGGIQPQAALLLPRAVARKTLVAQQRLDRFQV